LALRFTIFSLFFFLLSSRQTGQDDAALALEALQRLVGLVVVVLQPMALVAQDKAHLARVQHMRVQPERLVWSHQPIKKKERKKEKKRKKKGKRKKEK
jgi:hypothetical protein